MNSQPSPGLNVAHGSTVVSVHQRKPPAQAALADARAAGAESLQKTGKRMVVAGFVITIVGVVLYCAVSFAGGMNADMGDVLLKNAVPFARGTLAVLGLGTLVWLIGSFTYLRGAMDADQEPSED